MGLNEEEIKWLYTVLRKVEFLSVLTVGELDRLATFVMKKSFKKRSTVFKQGDKGDFFYIIYSGTVSIFSSMKGKSKQKIATLGSGEYFGEMALVYGDPRNSTVVVDDNDVNMFILFKNDFNSLVRDNPELGNKVQEVINRRNAQRSLELSHNNAPEKKGGFFSKILEFLGFSS